MKIYRSAPSRVPPFYGRERQAHEPFSARLREDGMGGLQLYIVSVVSTEPGKVPAMISSLLRAGFASMMKQ